MATDLDIVGTAGVDVVPVAPQFHQKLQRIVIPAAQRVGDEAGRIIGDRMSDAIVRQVSAALPQAVTAGGQAAQRQASRQGSDTGGAFARSLRTKLEAAFKAMPKLDIRLSDAGVDAELARLRARMETLAGKKIGVDVDVAAAEVEVRKIEAELERLGASHPNVAVRADTATARAALAEIRAEIAAVDAKDVHIGVDVDTTGARSALMSLGIQMIALAAIPLGPVIAAGLGSVVAMATAAGAGVGALALAAIPAVKGVGEALKAQTAAQDDATKAAQRSAAAGARAASQAASHALQLAGAQASLTAAHRNAERTIVQASRAIEDAERSLAQTGIRAAEQRRQAAESVERAERSLADAKRDALKAEQDLSAAREEAAKELADQRKELSTRLEDSSLDERDAVLRVKEAQAEFAKIMKDPKATDLQKQRAQLAADEAEHALKRQREEIKNLRIEMVRNTLTSVDGSDQVKRAQERVADAQQKVKDEAQAVADAQTAAARVQVQAAQEVADAQRRVADAVDNSANAQVAAAEAIASAERGVAAARLSSASSTSTLITKQDEYLRALAKLTPAQRALYDSIAGPQGLKTAFKDWSTSLQPQVLPIFTRGVDGAKAALPGLTPLVLGAASAVQTLMDKASAQIKTPFWQEFKADLKNSVEPAIVGFGVAFGNVIKGVAGIIDAFLPHMDGIAQRSDSITAKFAKWGTSLKGSPDFEKFLQYVKETTPGLGAFLRELFAALLDVMSSLRPVSETLYTALTPVLNTISWLATHVPELVITLWAMWAAQKAVAVGMAAFAAAMTLYESVMILATIATSGWAVALNATGIVPIIRAIVLVLGLLVAAVIYAYNNWDWFRETVDTVASAIGTAISWLWTNILKPVFDGIWWVIKKVGDIAVWLWETILQPVFSAIWEAAKILFTILVVAVLTPIWLAFKTLGKIALWLWEEALSPIFGWIGDKAKQLWTDYIRPHFSEMKKIFEAVGWAFKWVWDHFLSPILGWIGDKVMALYQRYIKPYLGDIKRTFDVLGIGIKWLWDKYANPILSWIGDKASWLYRYGIKPAFSKISTAIDILSKSFEIGKDAIGKAWDKVQGIAKKPVRFIIEKVYNGGIVPMWNKVADITGVDPLKPLDLRGFARGGILPGQSTWRQGDDQLVPMRRGEGVYVSEAMRDPYERARLHAVNRAAMAGQPLTQFQGGYAEGGIVGWLEDKASDIGDFLSNPLDVFSGVKRFITERMKGILTNPWARSIAKMPGKILGGLKDKALGLLGFDANGNAVGGGGGGAWVRPVDVPFGTPFGQRGSMWSSGQHTGLDFPAAVGTAIHAVAGGHVSMAQSGGPYGVHVVINHGGGLASLYGHMSEMLTHVGAQVRAGETIGRVGATGNVTGPHLHLEARRNGTPVDPMPFFTNSGGGGGSGVERWRSVVLQALRLTGNPAGYADLTLRRMNQESGGNPNAVNTWDSNAKNGTPSVGLMQVIKPTFEAFAGHMRNVQPKVHGVSTNPLANVYSSMRYAMSRYGSLPTAYNRLGGYATGGFPGVGELAWVGENGPELVRFLHPTQVYSNSDSAAMVRQAATLQAGAGRPTQLQADIHVYVGDREITDIVDTRIELRDAATASALIYGRTN